MHLPALPPLPPLPPIMADFPQDEAAMRGVRALLADGACHNPFNQFRPAGVLNKWGREAQFRAMAVRVSPTPFDGVAPEASLAPGLSLHVALEAEDGTLHGYAVCRSPQEPRSVAGAALRDARGRTWFCAAEGPEILSPGSVFTGTAPLEKIGAVSLAVAIVSPVAAAPLEDPAGFAGQVEFQGQVLTAVRGEGVVKHDDAPAHLASGMAALSARVEAIVARENRIRDAAENVITTEALRKVLSVGGFPLNGFFPNRKPETQRDFHEAVFALAHRVALNLRDAGLCAPCPNGGFHDARGIEAWNLFVAGELDTDPGHSRGSGMFFRWHELEDAPLFKMIRSEIIRATVNAERAAQEEIEPGFQLGRGPKIAASEADLDRMLPKMREDILDALATENPRYQVGENLESQLEGSYRLCLAGSFLEPVLGTRDRETGEIIPLPVEDEPKIVRHLQLSLPSGRLYIAGGAAPKGFDQVLDDTDSFVSINHASGRDANVRDAYERLGLVVAHVYDRGGDLWADRPGTWRMGDVDEDAPEAASLAPDSRAFSIYSDGGINVMADPEVVADILMASGRYAARAEAMAALEAEVDAGEAEILEIGADRLHLYMPTGYGDEARFSQVFRAAELDHPNWREDRYVLSVTPLTVDPAIVDEPDWVEGRAAPRPDRSEEPDGP